jgi:hypothetical protein
LRCQIEESIKESWPIDKIPNLFLLATYFNPGCIAHPLLKDNTSLQEKAKLLAKSAIVSQILERRRAAQNAQQTAQQAAQQATQKQGCVGNVAETLDDMEMFESASIEARAQLETAFYLAMANEDAKKARERAEGKEQKPEAARKAQDFDMLDCITLIAPSTLPLFHSSIDYIWSTPYLHPHITQPTQTPTAGYSDHGLLSVILNRATNLGIGRGVWRMNIQILSDPTFKTFIEQRLPRLVHPRYNESPQLHWTGSNGRSGKPA